MKKSAHILPSEAVYGVLAWLTGRKKVLKIGGKCNCGPVAEVAAEFVRANKLRRPRKRFPNNMKYPSEPTGEKE